MKWEAIKTEADYQIALKRIVIIFNAKADTPEANELNLLIVLVKDYEDKNVHLPI